MGAGKTTAAKILAKYLRFELIEENFGENAFLSRFYKDMQKWAFHSQSFFLMEKLNQMLKTADLIKKKSVIQDTPLYQDVFSYAKAQHITGHMDDAEWKLYQKIYRSFVSYIPKPTHIIYLKTSLDIVKNRIAGRRRSFESQIPDGYLELLEMLNDGWMKKEIGGERVLVVETDHLDLVKNKNDIRAFVKLVKNDIALRPQKNY